MISGQHTAWKGNTMSSEPDDISTEHLAAAGEIIAQSGAEALRRYWTSGEGGRLIRWGEPGDFMRCVRRVNRYMTTEQAKGFCNERHQDALGVPPGGEG